MAGARCRNGRRGNGDRASRFATLLRMVTTEVRRASLKSQCLQAKLCHWPSACAFATPPAAIVRLRQAVSRPRVRVPRFDKNGRSGHIRDSVSEGLSMLPDGYSDVPAGKLAAVVTCLEMGAPPPLRSDPGQPGITLERVARPDVAWYRALYSRIGTEWLWASRLALSEGDLAAIIHHPDVEVYAVMKDGQGEGAAGTRFPGRGGLRTRLFRPDTGDDRQWHGALADEPGDRAGLVARGAGTVAALLGAHLHAGFAAGARFLHPVGLFAGQAPGRNLRRSAADGCPASDGCVAGTDRAAIKENRRRDFSRSAPAVFGVVFFLRIAATGIHHRVVLSHDRKPMSLCRSKGMLSSSRSMRWRCHADAMRPATPRKR